MPCSNIPTAVRPPPTAIRVATGVSQLQLGCILAVLANNRCKNQRTRVESVNLCLSTDVVSQDGGDKLREL